MVARLAPMFKMKILIMEDSGDVQQQVKGPAKNLICTPLAAC
jgi:hypothetical protein